ncbi:MAG TPA: prepilin-type N-terminal cleavage/methylation domain-containing protein [Candidatus Bathyarchaeia archaeon]|nr:prepilin-type N-terminal cleavage/methylation domain-containing protein [Candidatus Bathyarchaeia archaeon]
MMQVKKEATGFTLIEILLTVGLLAILLGLGTIVFGNFSRQDQLNSTAEKIVSCLSEAQTRTVAGYSLGQAAAFNFGVHFNDSSYTIFPGTAFDPNDVRNQRFELPATLEIKPIFLPLSNIVFEKITGEVRDYNPSQNYLILTGKQSGKEKNIIINKLGVAKIE